MTVAELIAELEKLPRDAIVEGANDGTGSSVLVWRPGEAGKPLHLAEIDLTN